MEEAVRQRFERIEAILDSVARKQAAARMRARAAEVRRNKPAPRPKKFHYRHLAGGEARFEKSMLEFEKLSRIHEQEIAIIRRIKKESDRKLSALIDAQQRTDATLRAFLDSVRKGGNGGGRRVQ